MIPLLLHVPLQVWCMLRHRRQWHISMLYWGWACPVDQFAWPFTEREVRRIVKD